MRAGASGGGFVLSTLGNDRQVVLLRNVPFPSLARALVLRPSPSVRSLVVDWARLHFGKAPNVSIVAAGGGEGRWRRPTKPRQGHKHHENMVLSGRQPAANEATERCRLQHLFGRLGPSRVCCSMCSMHAWNVVHCAGLPRHPIPLVSPPDT